ncbi:hypothetical protein J8Z28_07630 [Pseudoalteromonas sp. SCSIO 43088]|uniref:Rad52/Rad22 family DNA repair protein n=1 Tax=Pseudoalteromonas sp. SCSIO 43088 TaxID=2822846 RepID=UPI00202B67E8|nr:Rad52/Rad22 family DNA repair protein [Pseudoalteromonas sp. SCSIO 43088]URQ87702.1 hypothetical protein J8Z28_07630 [Pseudoalteromonas sp. SCSIO 43088]
MDAKQIFQRLADPFEPEHLEWRVQASGISFQGNPWVRAIAYVDNRAIQARLDEVLGPMNWRNEYEKTESGYLCGLSIRVDNEWITKYDGAEFTSIEKLKGALSGSMKRAAVQFGIGRYLYALEADYVTVIAKNDAGQDAREDGFYARVYKDNRNKRKQDSIECYWFPPALPTWALPRADLNPYLEAIKESNSLSELKKVYETARRAAEAFNKIELRNKVNALTKAKKAELEKQAEQQAIEKSKEFHSWLIQRISDLIINAENESILNLNHKKLLQEVKGHCRANKIDATNFVSQVNEAHQQALINLRN